MKRKLILLTLLFILIFNLTSYSDTLTDREIVFNSIVEQNGLPTLTSYFNSNSSYQYSLVILYSNMKPVFCYSANPFVVYYDGANKPVIDTPNSMSCIITKLDNTTVFTSSISDVMEISFKPLIAAWSNTIPVGGGIPLQILTSHSLTNSTSIPTKTYQSYISEIPYQGYTTYFSTTDIIQTLTYTNNTDYPITIELFSNGYSNVTITSPSKWSDTSDIGTSKLPFDLIPLETFTVTLNTGDPINIGIKPQSEYAPIELPNEYLYITSPPEGKQTIDKWMTYNIMYSIQASKIEDVQINVRDINGSPFSQNPQVKSFESLNHNAIELDGYVKGSLQVFVDYNSSFTGSIGTKVKIINNVTKKELSLTRNVEILPFLDSNSDGYDDVTGEDLYIRPVIPSMDDLSITDSVAALTNIIPSLTSFI